MDCPPVLCVDDEPAVLEGLKLNLRKNYTVTTATSGAEGLEILKKDSTIAIVLADMRMPQMDGAAFLSKARQTAPEAVRMLLTGQTDIESAIAAINDGQIFRFLSKPCPPERLLKAFEAALIQHRLITSERVLLEETLRGSIKALTDVLSLTNPVAFGRSSRVKKHVCAILQNFPVLNPWQVEVAAMVSEIGGITLPPETAKKLYYGDALNPTEQAMADKIPEVAQQLLGHIPRLEPVIEILSYQYAALQNNGVKSVGFVPVGAKILRVAIEYDKLDGQGHSPQAALDTMRKQGDIYDSKVLEVFNQVLSEGSGQPENVAEIPIQSVKVGMVFTEDVLMKSGTLFVSRGFEVSESFVQRVKNIEPGSVVEPVHVTYPDVKER